MNSKNRFVCLVYSIISVVVASALPSHAAAPCALSTTSPSVTVCTPAPNALVQSPVHVSAGTTDSNTVTTVQIYVDNKLYTQVKAATIDSFVNLPVGYHLITVQGWDTTGTS